MSMLVNELAKGDLLYPRYAGPVGEVVDRPQVALTEDKAQHLLHPCGTCRIRGRGRRWGCDHFCLRHSSFPFFPRSNRWIGCIVNSVIRTARVLRQV